MKSLKPILALVCLGVLFSAGAAMLTQNNAYAHCQIPCGIYGDETRFTILREHITTLEKSMKQIAELSADPGKNANQLARWVNNKEAHADEFAEIVVKYFLQQRIKTNEADADKYVKKLTICHKMLVATMKAKQTTDTQYTDELTSLLQDFSNVYFTEEQKKHMKEHK